MDNTPNFDMFPGFEPAHQFMGLPQDYVPQFETSPIGQEELYYLPEDDAPLTTNDPQQPNDYTIGEQEVTSENNATTTTIDVIENNDSTSYVAGEGAIVPVPNSEYSLPIYSAQETKLAREDPNRQGSSLQPTGQFDGSVGRGGTIRTDAIFEVNPNVAAAFNGLAVQNTYVKVQKTMLQMLQGLASKTETELADLRKQLNETQDRARTERYRMEDNIAGLERRVLELERTNVSLVRSERRDDTSQIGFGSLSQTFTANQTNIGLFDLADETIDRESPARTRCTKILGGKSEAAIVLPSNVIATQTSDVANQRSGKKTRTDADAIVVVPPNQNRSTLAAGTDESCRDEKLCREVEEDKTRRSSSQSRRRKRAGNKSLEDSGTNEPFALGRMPKDDFEKLLLKVLVGKNDTFIGRVFMLPLLNPAKNSPAGFLLNVRMLRLVAKLLYPETFLVFPRGGLKPVSIDFLRSLLLEFGAKRAPEHLLEDPAVRPFAVKESASSTVSENWLVLPVGFLIVAEVASGRHPSRAPTKDKIDRELETFYGRKGAWPPRRSFDSVLHIRMPTEDVESSPNPDDPSPFAGPLTRGSLESIDRSRSQVVVVRHLGSDYNVAMGYPDILVATHFSGPWPMTDLPVLDSLSKANSIAFERLSLVPFAPVKKASGKRTSSTKLHGDDQPKTEKRGPTKKDSTAKSSRTEIAQETEFSPVLRSAGANAFSGKRSLKPVPVRAPKRPRSSTSLAE